MLAFRRHRVGWIVAALCFAGAALAADGIEAIETKGQGRLTMCRSWLVYDDCNVYNHVALPSRVAVGDTISLTFGSNNKHYNFPVVRIIKNGLNCTMLSQVKDSDGINKIRVASCLDVSDHE
jgi:hypothetical protein